MPNVNAVLREEILRLARKEIRATVGPLKKKVADLRRLSSSLKQKVETLEKATARLSEEAEARGLQKVRAGEEDTRGARLGPRSIRSQRGRLGLTRDEFGRLAGVSANAVYLWETGRVSPREKSKAVLVGLRKLGAREARRLLAAQREGEKTRRPRRPRKAGRGLRRAAARKR